MVKTARTTFRILETIKAKDEVTLTELTNEFTLSKSSIHNYLKTLEHDGYVVREGNTYRVGLRLLDLGGYARYKEPIYQSAKEEVTKLAEETGEMTNLLVEEHGRGIYLHRANGEQAVTSDSYIGHRVYLHNTALGQAILAHLPNERVDEIIDRHGLPKTTENTITDRDELFDQLERVREEGVAFDDEARLVGLRCVAKPIVNKEGEIEGAISISGPTSRFQDEHYQTVLPKKLESAANVIELNINYT
ncbi:IclR family transcriptional regulator [Halogeometricum pallidum JCM 14848]|uniref:IclR family transcriptional regulator n=2 Tax=Halogeometricum TaxID=60846 RepID=M0DAY2_HALPD|nr:IclR family transcriptional regulator [Halogeometricum pallidum JCM 14848]